MARSKQREKIAEAVACGDDPGEVARRYGVTFSYVRTICREHGVPWPWKGGKGE